MGLLRMSLYGTRDAAANFQAEVKRVMERAGFKTSRYNPSTYYNPFWELRSLVHGDDFVTGGEVEELMGFKQVLSAKFEISTQVIGTSPNEATESQSAEPGHPHG